MGIISRYFGYITQILSNQLNMAFDFSICDLDITGPYQIAPKNDESKCLALQSGLKKGSHLEVRERVEKDHEDFAAQTFYWDKENDVIFASDWRTSLQICEKEPKLIKAGSVEGPNKNRQFLFKNESFESAKDSSLHWCLRDGKVQVEKGKKRDNDSKFVLHPVW